MNSFDFSLYESISDNEKENIKPSSSSFDFSIYEPIPADSPSDKEFTTVDKAKDYAKQFAKEGLIGVGGTWGDLAELAGLNQENAAIEAKNSRDFDVLTKMQDPNYNPSFMESFEDISSLDSDDDIGPRTGRLPTSKDLRKLNETIGGPGEAETEWGKLGGRQGKLYGSVVTTGQLNPIPALLAGGVGQGLEELGVGETGQMIGEIVTLLASPGGSKGQLGERASRQVKEKINELRRIGYTDEQITLAINHASKGKKWGIKATKGAKTEEIFEQFAEHSADLVSDILQSEIPGIQRGTQYVHELASNAYGQVAREASQLVIKDSTPFIRSATNVVREVRRNLGNSPEAQSFLNRLHDAIVASTQRPTAENFMNFYKELNKAGNWMSRNQKDRLINQVKNGIKDTFRSEGQQGRRLAERFEQANAGIRKAYQAEDVHNLLQKTVTQDGTDFKKMYKLFDKPENVHLFEDVLGIAQTNNLRTIAKTAKEVKDFDKAWKGATLIPQSTKSYVTHAGYLLMSGNWPALAALKGVELSARKLSEKMLTDPKFQNLMIRTLHSVKNKYPRTTRNNINQMQKYLDDNYIDINLKTKD